MDTHFGTTSLANLETAHPALRATAFDVDEVYPHGVRDAWRNGDRQQEMYDSGASKAKRGESKHEVVDKEGNPCSHALDVYPDGIGKADWQEFCEKGRRAVELMPRFTKLTGMYIAVGRKHGLILRSGDDWDGDTKNLGKGFLDAPHVEIVGFLPGFGHEEEMM